MIDKLYLEAHNFSFGYVWLVSKLSTLSLYFS